MAATFSVFGEKRNNEQVNHRNKGVLDMTSQQCAIIGCDRQAEANGMCEMHFTRALVYGQVRTPQHKAVLGSTMAKAHCPA